MSSKPYTPLLDGLGFAFWSLIVPNNCIIPAFQVKKMQFAPPGLIGDFGRLINQIYFRKDL